MTRFSSTASSSVVEEPARRPMMMGDVGWPSWDALEAFWQGYFATLTKSEMDAQERAKQLLRSWLSPEQLRSFDSTGGFNVVGSQSGRLYRINPVQNYNVVDQAGTAYCFCPSPPFPALPLYDNMLAQKLALETNEEEAMRVANPRPNAAYAPAAEPLTSPPPS